MAKVYCTTDIAIFSFKKSPRESLIFKERCPYFSMNPQITPWSSGETPQLILYSLCDGQKGLPCLSPCSLSVTSSSHPSLLQGYLHTDWKLKFILQSLFLVTSDRYNSLWNGINIKAMGKGGGNAWLAAGEGRRTLLSLLSAAEIEFCKHKTEITNILSPSSTQGKCMHYMHCLQL